MDLSSSIEELSFVGPIYARKCEKLGIKTIEDLLLHAPHRYDDFSLVSPISRVELGKALTVKGKPYIRGQKFLFPEKLIFLATNGHLFLPSMKSFQRIKVPSIQVDLFPSTLKLWG